MSSNPETAGEADGRPENADLPTTRDEDDRKPWEPEVSPTETLDAATEGMRSLRLLLSEVAKTAGIIAAIFLAIVFVVVSFEFMMFVIEFL